MLTILQLIMPTVTAILGRLIQDPKIAADAQIEIQKALIEREADLQKAISDAARAQAEINLKEAEHPSLFVSGWRPAVAWVCVFGCLYAFMLHPVLSWASTWIGIGLPPQIDTSTMIFLLTGLLGLGTLRTTEKLTGTARDSLARPTLKRTE